MSQKEKFPELYDQMEKLQEEKLKLEEKTAPIKKERDRLVIQIEPKRKRIRELTDEINAIERPRIIELSNQISALATMMGGRKMSDGTPRS